MDIGYIYQKIYLIFCAIILFVSFDKIEYCSDDTFTNRKEKYLAGLLISFLLSVIIGFRPLSLSFTDMGAYDVQYSLLFGEQFRFNPKAENVLFDNILALCASIGIPVDFYFFFVACFYFIGMYYACERLFPQYTLISYVVWLTAFCTFSGGTNGIKAGAGATAFLLALAYREKLWISIALGLVSVGMHHSMIVVLYAYIISLSYKNTKMYFYGWIFCAIVATLHIGFFQQVFAGFADDRGAAYLTADSSSGYMTGFRPDFMLYSAMPIIVGYWLIFKKKVQVSSMYTLLLRLYLLTNSIWMLCMYASFTNRIAFLSWFLYPTVLIYPYLTFYWDERQLIMGKKVAIYHLLFTLFMVFVYYA